jgi:hypothetical protein
MGSYFGAATKATIGEVRMIPECFLYQKRIEGIGSIFTGWGALIPDDDPIEVNVRENRVRI